MKAKVSLKLGNAAYEFEVEEQEEMQTLHKAIVLSNPRTKCICGNGDPSKFYFTSNKDKEANTYVNVKCAVCGARSKLGQYKSKGYFWHEFEKFVPNRPVTEEQPPF